MRRRKLFLYVSIVGFFCWIVILYLFAHQPILVSKVFENFKGVKDVDLEVDKIERNIKQQLISNEELLSSLRRLEKKILETGKNIDRIIEDEPNFVKDSLRNPQMASKFNDDLSNPIIGILVFACNRVTVRRNIDQLLKYRPSNETHLFPIVISQDCGHAPTKKVIESYGDQVKLIEQPDKSDFILTGKEKKFKGYYKIARHYKWALDQMFNTLNYNTVIIVEDDLDVSPDFFEFFRSLYPILKTDSTLWCISAWNDNGKEALVSNTEALYRSDFFPGLGWMLTKDLWGELQPKWPKAFWDDWIRQPAQRKDRACIRPEISRTKTFGKIGVSNGLFYEKHLKFIKLNEQYVPFTKKNLTYLLRENYDVSFLKVVYSSPVLTIPEIVQGKLKEESSVRVTYRSKDQFKKSAKVLGLMDDFKSGVPRTGYRGIVSCIYRKRRVFLAPPPDWKGYDISWT